MHLLRPKQHPSKAQPWVWKDSSWRELWVAIDGFSVEKRIRGEDPALSNRVFVEEHEELPVYTRDKHKTSSFAIEKQGYIAITMAGYGVVAAVALHTATKQHGSREPHAPTRFKFWTEQIVEQGLGDAATEAMLRDRVWEVWHTPVLWHIAGLYHTISILRAFHTQHCHLAATLASYQPQHQSLLEYYHHHDSTL